MRNARPVKPEPATNVVVNCSQVKICWLGAVAGGTSEFTAVKIVEEFTCTSTVLVVPRIPPGSLTFPTQNERLY